MHNMALNSVKNKTDVYGFHFSGCLSRRPLTYVNILGLPCNSYMLLEFTICSELKIKSVPFIFRSQGQSKELLYIIVYGGKSFAVYLWCCAISGILKWIYIIEMHWSMFISEYCVHLSFTHWETQKNWVTVLSISNNCWNYVFNCGMLS